MKNLKECSYYTKEKDYKVQCILCPHMCKIGNGYTGLCKVRKNIEGTLYSLNYGIISSYGMDPIEKKPLNNFYPQRKIFSIGSFGCNLRCTFCQNYRISQVKGEGVETTPKNIVDIAIREDENLGIAFTYNEPTVGYEFVKDTAMLNRENNKKNVLVTNGYINRKPMEELLPYIDAMNIDLKFSTEENYKKVAGGSLKPVLDTIELCNQKCHVEVTTLVVTGYNDNIEAIEDIAKMLSKIDSKIPLHLSRYFPNYKYEEKATSIEFMYEALDIALKYLDTVYLGNI